MVDSWFNISLHVQSWFPGRSRGEASRGRLFGFNRELDLNKISQKDARRLFRFIVAEDFSIGDSHPPAKEMGMSMMKSTQAEESERFQAEI
jgi:hypothetical protein